MRVIVTRPSQEAAQWVHALRRCRRRRRGPALDWRLCQPHRHGRRLQLALRRAWVQRDAVMFVSGNAVYHFFKMETAVSPRIRYAWRYKCESIS